jgi:prepilin-type N-terminal cleavage/methylation domain-containing protein
MKFAHKSMQTHGFTLVEMIVVMAIMSVVVMAVMSLFIPAQRATVVQTQLADVQSNLRLSIERITKDIRNAGFLVPSNTAITGYNAATLDSSSLVITSRSAVSGRFGSLTDYAGGSGADEYTLLYEDQVRFFRPGDFVAFLHPLSGNVLGGAYFKVSATDIPNKTVTIKTSGGSDLSATQKEAVNATFNEPNNLLLLAPDPSVLPASYTQTDLNNNMIRTITYALENGTLTRVVSPPLEPGGNTKQYLARNISDLRFLVEEDADGDVFKVTIEVEGETGQVSSDAVGSAKSKRYRTVVSLRNI